MFDNDRINAVRRLIFDYLESPSLRHLRDPHSVNKLARQVLDAVDQAPIVWRKWEGQREALLKAAAATWIPIEDLRSFLNELPGPALTLTDVVQRMRAFNEEPDTPYANPVLKEACLAIYNRERAEGTEMPAIIAALQEYAENEAERLREEQLQAWRKRQEEDRLALEQRFLSGADCKWTPINGSRELYVRRNGRAYRLAQNPQKRWELFRIHDLQDRGSLLGTYVSRGDASKALTTIAFSPEARA